MNATTAAPGMRTGSFIQTHRDDEMIEIEKINRCSDCRSRNLVSDLKTGELICESCGLVVSKTYIDYGPEWRAYDVFERETRPRVGAPISWIIHDKGLSTMIDMSGRDAYGHRLKENQRYQIYRINKLHCKSKVSESTDRNLSQALSEIKKACEKLNLPWNIVETASIVYRQALRRELIKGRSIREVAAASIYIACRQCNVIRSLEEVGQATQLTKKKTAKIYRLLLRRMNPNVPRNIPNDYVPKYVNQLSLSGGSESIALNILDHAVELKLTIGRGPAGIAAAAVYIASMLMDENPTQDDLSDIGDITSVTLRTRYKELMNKLMIEINV